jgi:hypothetical protein
LWTYFKGVIAHATKQLVIAAVEFAMFLSYIVIIMKQLILASAQRGRNNNNDPDGCDRQQE